jgi:transcriptional regulator with XRE-family HTH domain
MNPKAIRVVAATMAKVNNKDFVPAQKHATLTTGEVIKSLRELKGWTQEELARRTGISATNLSALENDRLDIGKKRAMQLAHAFNVHPAVIMFPEHASDEMKKAA